MDSAMKNGIWPLTAILISEAITPPYPLCTPCPNERFSRCTRCGLGVKMGCKRYYIVFSTCINSQGHRTLSFCDSRQPNRIYAGAILSYSLRRVDASSETSIEATSKYFCCAVLSHSVGSSMSLCGAMPLRLATHWDRYVGLTYLGPRDDVLVVRYLG